MGTEGGAGVFRAATVLGAVAVLCSTARAGTGGARPQIPVILISIDTLRADHLSAYGYRRIRTPGIDSFADHGTLFTNADAQIPLTLPSHTSLFTSTYPFENQIEENAEPVPGKVATLGTVLRQNGRKTAAFIGSVFLEREMGLDRGFDVYDSPFHFEVFSPMSGSMFFAGTGRNPAAVRERRDGALVIGAAKRWLAANRGNSVFVFVHLFDLHRPYEAPSSFPRRGGLSGYDTALEYVDQLLANFKKALVDGGWWDRSLVVLLSDHGESLGDHGEASHGYFIYESTLRVPLIFHWPGAAPEVRATEPAGLIDVAPTILDTLRVAAPESFEGRSLLGNAGSHGVYAETVHAKDAFGWAPLRGLRVGSYKYIDAPRPELYNLESDPGEVRNLTAQEPSRAREMQSQLVRLLARYTPKHTTPPGDAPPQTRALLASLGYLASGPRTAAGGPGADPKDRLPEFRLYESAQLYLYYGRLEEAAAALRRILARDPKNTLARRDLGGCYIEEHVWAKAREAFEQVLAVAPGDYVAQYELGLADERLGAYKEALEHLQAASRIAPGSAQVRRELEAVQGKAK